MTRMNHITNADEDRTSGYCCSVCGMLAPMDPNTCNPDRVVKRFRTRFTGSDMTICVQCWRQLGDSIDIDGAGEAERASDASKCESGCKHCK